MMKALKYFGLASGAAIALFVAVVIFSVFGLVYNLFFAPNLEYYRGHFLLTATVEVDGQTKSGSSVFEVAYNRIKQPAPGVGSSIIGASGTMPLIDMGNHGFLILSFSPVAQRIGTTPESNWKKCNTIYAEQFPTSVMIEKDSKKTTFRSKLDYIINSNEPYETTDYSLDAYVIKNDQINKVRFCELRTYSKGKIVPLKLEIQKTNAAILKDNPYSGRPKIDAWAQAILLILMSALCQKRMLN